jgi:hypothetical protein
MIYSIKYNIYKINKIGPTPVFVVMLKKGIDKMKDDVIGVRDHL